MYELFEVAKLLSVRKDEDVSQLGAVNPTDVPESPTPSRERVCIKKYAWKEEGEKCLLALYCSNNYLLLQYKSINSSPSVKQIPWPNDKIIVSLCFDPTLVWLLILTNAPDIYIIPALCILEPNSKVNQLWATNDSTLIQLRKTIGVATKVCWWHTLEDDHIAIYGTKSGEIVFVDLLKRKTVKKTTINGTIMDLDIVQDDQQVTTSLLITGTSGDQWKLLLESSSPQRWMPTSDDSFLGADKRFPMVKNILMKSDSLQSMFSPIRFQQFERSVILYPQYAKGRHFVTAHCDKTSTYQVYDSHLEHSPFFIYKLPIGTYDVILTDNIIFAVSSVNGQRLLVISNQKAEISSEDQQDFNKDSIIQTFELPQGEKVLGTEKKSFPFYYHEKAEAVLNQKSGRNSASLESIPISSHTVLDGCIIVTNSSVFECRPRISPERLFINLAVENRDASVAESLGISVGLNLSNLLELAADYLLKTNSTVHALNLYHISKCSYVKRVTSLLKHKHFYEAITLLQRVLDNSHIELSTAERKQLSDLSLRTYIYLIGTSQNTSSEFLQDFKNFLLGSFSFDEKVALELLAEYGFLEQLLDFAKARGLVMEALDLLQSKGRYNIPLNLLEDLISRGFQAHLLKAGEGTFINCLCSEDLVSLLLVKPQLAVQYIHLLEPEIPHLSVELLYKVAEVFDPSKHLMQGFLKRNSRSRQRTSSLNSLTSYLGEGGEVLTNSTLDLSQLVEFFLKVVLFLNNRRQNLDKNKKINTKELLTNWDFDYSQVKELISNQKKPKLALQTSLIGAGPDHAAAVRNGDLYTWGLEQDGRLGHGDLVANQSVCPPCRVETLHMLQIKVSSVSCGGKHTLVITQQGVYGWGSSIYGQVGVGTRHTYTRPMLLETFLQLCETIVAIECGQYHSLALSENDNVYSWGWGVHGQLAHGDAEDQLVPTKIQSLCDAEIIKIAAGYCHSLFLSATGDVHSCGCAYFGQIGVGDNNKRTLPTLIEGIPEAVIFVATRYFHSIAITASNRVYTWGCHPYNLRFSAHSIRRARQQGQPMLDPIEGFLFPFLLDTSFVHGKLIQVACGSFHTVALTEDGEMFVWGRNVDGQLGIGHKIEEKIPVMLTKLNDQHMNSVRCGGEYSIAVDNDGQVWVWGKNETGQLGLPMVMAKSNPVVKRSSPNHKRHTHGGGTTQAVATPTKLNTLPSHDFSGQLPWQQGLFASTESCDSGHWVSEYYGEDCEIYRLPNLCEIGDKCYCSRIIPVVLKHMPSYCNSLTILRQAVDIGDWQTAADINILNHNHSQALCCHLFMLSKMNTTNEEDLFDISADIIDKHLSVTERDRNKYDIKEREIDSMCIEIIDHWKKWNLPITKLESIFIKYISFLASSLSLILFQKSTTDSTSVSSAMFSTSFNLRVLNALLSGSSESPENSLHQRLAKWMTLMAINIDDERAEGDKSPDLQPPSKLIPYSRLWSDIIHNLQKHLGDRLCVSVTRSELDFIGQTVTGEPTEEQQMAIFFTCGHNQPKQVFYQDILSYFEKELNAGITKLPYTATLLTQYYKRQGYIPMACPKCVLNAIFAVS